MNMGWKRGISDEKASAVQDDNKGKELSGRERKYGLDCGESG